MRRGGGDLLLGDTRACVDCVDVLALALYRIVSI
jgi:hypothetical protein